MTNPGVLNCIISGEINKGGLCKRTTNQSNIHLPNALVITYLEGK